MLAGSKVYVVDDDLTIRILLEGVFSAAELDVETYSSAEEFLDTYNRDNFGCLLLDIMMPGMDGLELQQKLVARGNKTPVIFLTGAAEVSVAIKAFKAGAVDFIEKPVQPRAVVNCVKMAMELDLKNRYKELHVLQIQQRISQLTPREYEVMNWIVDGKSNKEIARILGISGRTVEVHRRNVFAKMSANAVAELVQMVLEVQK